MTTYYRISRRQMTVADLHGRHRSELWAGAQADGDVRAGLSVCPTYADLVSYFRGDQGLSLARGADLEGAWLVELRGELSGDQPWEPEHEALIHPTEIVSQEPVTARFVADLIDLIQAGLPGGDTARCVAGVIVVTDDCPICRGVGTLTDDGETDECTDCDGTGYRVLRRSDR